MPKYNHICKICNSSFSTYRENSKTCSNECKSLYQTGINNPNFGKKWTSERKENHSQLIKNKFITDSEYRHKTGSANRGKKFSADRIFAMHNDRSKDSYSHKHSENTKKLIGLKSKDKFTDEYKINHKKNMIAKGHWIDNNDKSDYEIYFNESNWVEPMWNFFKFPENGIFNIKNNIKGSVRDHILSRWDAFNLGIWPELIRHPANCQIIKHSTNSSKRKKSHITYDELKNKILSFDSFWFEQQLCLDRIKQYDSGIIWKRKEVVGE